MSRDFRGKVLKSGPSWREGNTAGEASSETNSSNYGGGEEGMDSRGGAMIIVAHFSS